MHMYLNELDVLMSFLLLLLGQANYGSCLFLWLGVGSVKSESTGDVPGKDREGSQFNDIPLFALVSQLMCLKSLKRAGFLEGICFQTKSF